MPVTLYRRPFSEDVKIGIISTPGSEYDPDQGWRHTQGVKELIVETGRLVASGARFRVRQSRHLTFIHCASTADNPQQ